MSSKLYSVARHGIESQLVEVEVDVAKGLHSFSIVGLPDKAVGEAKERISTALKNNNFKPPLSFNKRIVINLAPADVKKEGSIYDLPMALGFLLDSKQLETDLSDKLVVGELGLDGEIRPVRGALLYAIFAQEAGYKQIIVPKANKREAELVKGIEVVAPGTLEELVGYLEGRKDLPKKDTAPLFKNRVHKKSDIDFSQIMGQQSAKQALEIAATGGHNILFQGPPGSGKTLLARAAITILPDMTYEEAIEATKIESICGKLTKENPLLESRPFRAPHHTSSESAIIGGGAGLQPGEITRAHRGVLFLDEFPEFHRDVLESLRQPLEEGSITVARAKGIAEYPAQFMLIAAANPCPCGYFGDEKRECSCTTGSIIKYQRKLSGPLADRIDLHVNVPRQNYKKISSDELAESSYDIKKRVQAARIIQQKRFARDEIFTNSEMKLKHIKKYCKLDDETSDMLGRSIEAYKLSARAYHSILKTARTAADLRGSENIQSQDITLMIQYAKRDREVI